MVTRRADVVTRRADVVTRRADVVTRRSLVAAPLALAAAAAKAAEWPERSLRLVVSYPPGGPADILAREVAQPLGVRLGQQVVIDNRAGANGNIGAQAAARAAADGYTLFLLTSSQAANMALYRAPGYDVVADFAPITNIVAYPLVLVTNPATPVRSVPELLALARAEPGRLTFASAGSGGGAHLAAELFCQMAGVRMTHVPYRGTGPALLATVAAEVSLMFAGVSAALPHVAEGRLRALGVTAPARVGSAPALPTIAEAGVPGYEMASWLGLAAPAGTPAAIVSRLAEAVASVVAEPATRDKLARDGATIEVGAPAAFSRYLGAEVAKWAQVIRAAGATVD